MKISIQKRRTLCGVVANALLLAVLAGCSDLHPYPTPAKPPARHSTSGIRPSSEIRQRVLLIGDAGDPLPGPKGEPVLHKLTEAVVPQKTAMIFLGDNVYPKGLPLRHNTNRRDAERRLNAQLAAVTGSGARGYFIPGNHDWKSESLKKGENLKEQEDYVNAGLKPSGRFLPRAGGIVSDAIDFDGVRIIALDTKQWADLKPGCKDEAQAEAKLKGLIQQAGPREIMVVAHHPLATHGSHGGFYNFQDHVFPLTRFVHKKAFLPLPVVGSLFPLFRKFGISDEDVKSPSYQRMISSLYRVLAGKPPLIYAAGHDHSLQVLDGEKSASLRGASSSAARYILVSGLGSSRKASTVTHGADTLFSHLHAGFMAVDFMKDGRVLLEVIEPGMANPVFTRQLKP